jgi:GntR family transcriptional repressor for pyruvate dehydrogenase complex
MTEDSINRAGLPGRLIKPSKELYSDVIYDQIIAQICNGVFPIGTRLPSEQQFARMFEVSRPTVRQAIKRLQADGMIESRQGSGHVVRRVPPSALPSAADNVSIANLLQVYEARRALEGEIARLAALRASAEHLDRLRIAMVEMRESHARGALRPDPDMAFHQAVADACGNLYLRELFRHLVGGIQSGIAIALSITRLGSAERSQRVLDEHERIFEAICDRDGESASIAMRYHLDQARRRITDGSRNY